MSLYVAYCVRCYYFIIKTILLLMRNKDKVFQVYIGKYGLLFYAVYPENFVIAFAFDGREGVR
jgi:hypothetical protein